MNILLLERNTKEAENIAKQTSLEINWSPASDLKRNTQSSVCFASCLDCFELNSKHLEAIVETHAFLAAASTKFPFFAAF